MNNDEISDNISDKEWDDFVYSHPQGNIFQTRVLSRVYSETKKYSPINVVVVDPISHKIEGVMSGVIIREMDGILGSFSTHSVVQGGPLVVPSSNNDVVLKLVNKYDTLARTSALYNEIRNMYSIQTQLTPLKNYSFVDHLNFIINLNQSKDELWCQIHKSRRKNINRADKAGLIIEEMVNQNLIPIFYELLKATYCDVKVPLVDISLFESAFQHLVPINLAKFFLVRHKSEYIGARAVLLYKDMIYDWYAGADPDALSLYPNEYLVWHILKWGQMNRYSAFDFGGAGHPNKPYGPREFKRRFGGNLVNYGRNISTYSKGKTWLAEQGFSVYRKFFL